MIICIHAHRSNQQWIDQTLPDEEIQHIILDHLIEETNDFKVKKQVLKHLNELRNDKTTCFISTCSYFSAHLPEVYDLPIIALDTLLFQRICEEPKLQLVFTNEATIKGTLARYERFKNKNQILTVHLIPNIFEILMAGDVSTYKRLLQEGLKELNETIPFAVGQLSMEIAVESGPFSCLTLLRQEIEKIVVHK